MQLPFYTALGGALLGAAATGVADESLVGALPGFGIGYGIGRYITNRKQQQQVEELQDIIAKTPNANLKVLKALSKASGRVNTPIFIQTKGEPYDNAFWRGYPDPYIDPSYFKCLVKAKNRRKATVQDADVIVIGKNFKKYPVIAHELGHSADFATNKPALRDFFIPALLSTAGLAGIPAGMAVSIQDANVGAVISTLSAACLLGAATYSNYREAKRERAASKNAVEYIEKVKKSAVEREKARKLLETAYNTYEPIRLGSKKPFLYNNVQQKEHLLA